MSENEAQISSASQKPPVNEAWQLQTLYLSDTVGAVFLGILSVVLLIGWRRTESKYRALLAQKEQTDGNHSLDA